MKMKVRSLHYTGDPDLLPIKNDEITFLVRFFYQMSYKMNYMVNLRLNIIQYSS